MHIFMNDIGQFISNISGFQYASLITIGITIGAFKAIAKKSIRYVLSIIGILSAVYFVSPELYHNILFIIQSVLQAIISFLKV